MITDFDRFFLVESGDGSRELDNIYVCGSAVCERIKLLNIKRNKNRLQMVERVNKTGPE